MAELAEDALRWPLPAEDAFARTTLTCGHFGLLAEWTYPVIGQVQNCEICDAGRTIVDVEEFDRG